jgi:hypothetical protein
MKKCVIQVQYMSSSGFAMGDWQDLHHINNPTTQTVTSEMVMASKRIKRARIRAVDQDGRLVDIMPMVG